MCAAWDLTNDLNWLESLTSKTRGSYGAVEGNRQKLERKRDELQLILTEHAAQISDGDLKRICSLPDGGSIIEQHTEDIYAFEQPGYYDRLGRTPAERGVPPPPDREVAWDLTPIKKIAQKELDRRATDSP